MYCSKIITNKKKNETNTLCKKTKKVINIYSNCNKILLKNKYNLQILTKSYIVIGRGKNMKKRILGGIMSKAKLKKVLALSLSAAMMCTSTAWAQTGAGIVSQPSALSNDAGLAYKFTTDDSGKLVPTEDSLALESLSQGADKTFSWDNATVYFLLTDRFKNGNTSNDNSYGRMDYKFGDTRATFHGGDFAGITQKIEEGYFDDLGVNAIWLSAPYEQIHGYIVGSDSGDNYYHQSYHGYYVLDYTETDASFGTKEEFKELVTKAHEHGIRVVMDIVMNHAGYNSMQDMNEYGFGTLLSGWDSFYKTPVESNIKQYHSLIDYNSDSTAWGKWWGGSWIRSGVAGYPDTGESGSDYTRSLTGLPDFKTESTSSVGIPEMLKTKWTKEGTYDAKVAKYGSSGTVRTYLVKWLTEWVEEYGVDGFRCDTAKHVEKESWKALKDAGVAALKKWRQNNPSAPGANWTDDFWMTGEAWDHGVGYDDYYTAGGFDSMINFSTCGGGAIADKSKLDEVYSGYANQINTNSKFNVLSFMSSHDEVLMSASKSAKDMVYYGTAFLMLPGGVQIYYGEETQRPMVSGVAFDGSGGAGHSLRSDMNWNSIDQDLLAHYQKVGSFRNNHLAVGAGTHKQISASPYTFSRVYGDDKVVVSMPNSAGTYDISVSGIFEDGSMVTDAYSGEAYQVSGGTVSVTCDDNCTILLESGGKLTSSVNASGKKTYSTEKVTVKLIASLATDTYYSVNGGEKKAYENGDTIEIGGGTAYGESVKVEVFGKAEDGSALSNSATFTRVGEPVISDGVYRLKVKKTEYTSCPNIYVWQTDAAGKATELNGAWPGQLMTEDGDYWTYENKEAEGTVNFILNYSGAKDPAKDLSSEGSKIYNKDGSFTDIPSGTPCKVTAKFVDASGKDISGGAEVYRVGNEGDSYEIAARDIAGYTLSKTDGEVTGKFTSTPITVTFTYNKSGEIETTTKGQDETTTKKQDETTTKAQEETTTKGQEDTSKIQDETTTKTQDETTTKKQEETTTEEEETTTKKQEETTTKEEETTTKAQEETTKKQEETTTKKQEETTTKEEETTKKLEITDVYVSDNSGAVSVGDSVSLKVTAKGGSGTLKYKFAVRSDWDDIVKNYSTSNKATWNLTEAGIFSIVVYVKDESGAVVSKVLKNYVVNSKLKISSFKTSKASGKARIKNKVTLTVKAKGGSGSYTYRFAYKKSGTTKLVYTSGFKAKNKVIWKPSKAGKYTLYVYVKDAKTNKVVRKTISSYKVKK